MECDKIGLSNRSEQMRNKARQLCEIGKFGSKFNMVTRHPEIAFRVERETNACGDRAFRINLTITNV